MISTMTKPQATLNPALKPFWQAYARIRVLHGGRSSSKSWDAAGFAIFLAQKYKVKFLCTRQFQNKIEESVYSLLKIQIERFGLLDQFQILRNKIIHRRTGSEFLFYGLWRHIDEIKSLEGVDVCWIEEAHNLTLEQWEILEPTVRKQGSQFWIIFNPQYTNDFVYQRFVVNPPPGSVVRQINYTENPFLSQTMIDVIEAKKAEDYEAFQHTYLGVPRDDDDKVIIKRSWLMECIDLHKRLDVDLYGGRTAGYDVADTGQDPCANIIMNGSVCVFTDEWKAKEDELTKSTKRVLVPAKKHRAAIIYDGIGIGAHVGSTLKELKYKRYAPFIAGGKVVKPDKKYEGIPNKDYFSNLKAQGWVNVADRARHSYNVATKKAEFKPDDVISIDSDCEHVEQLITELSTPYKDFDKAGRYKVESKEDLADRGVKSPNLADSFIMANSKHLVKLARPVRDIL